MMKQSYLVLAGLFLSVSAWALEPQDCAGVFGVATGHERLLDPDDSWGRQVAVAEQYFLGKLQGRLLQNAADALLNGEGPKLADDLFDTAELSSKYDGALGRAIQEFNAAGEPSRRDNEAPPRNYSDTWPVSWWESRVLGKARFEFSTAEELVAQLGSLKEKQRLGELSNVAKTMPPLTLEETLRILGALPEWAQSEGLTKLWPRVFTPVTMLPLDYLATILARTSPTLRQALWRQSKFELTPQRVRALIVHWPHLIREVQEQGWPMGFAFAENLDSMHLPKGSIPISVLPSLLNWIPNRKPLFSILLRKNEDAHSVFAQKLQTSGLLSFDRKDQAGASDRDETFEVISRYPFENRAHLVMQHIESARSAEKAIEWAAGTGFLDAEQRAEALLGFFKKNRANLSLAECRKIAHEVSDDYSSADRVYKMFLDDHRGTLTLGEKVQIIHSLLTSAAKNSVLGQFVEDAKDSYDSLKALENLVDFGYEETRNRYYTLMAQRSTSPEEQIQLIAKIKGNSTQLDMLAADVLRQLVGRYVPLDDVVNLLNRIEDASTRLELLGLFEERFRSEDLANVPRPAERLIHLNTIEQVIDWSSTRVDQGFSLASVQPLLKVLAERSLEGFQRTVKARILDPKIKTLTAEEVSMILSLGEERIQRAGQSLDSEAVAAYEAFVDEYLVRFVNANKVRLTFEDVLSLSKLSFYSDCDHQMFVAWLGHSGYNLTPADLMRMVSVFRDGDDVVKFLQSVLELNLSALTVDDFLNICADRIKEAGEKDQLIADFESKHAAELSPTAVQDLINLMEDEDRGKLVWHDYLSGQSERFRTAEIKELLDSMQLEAGDRSVLELMLRRRQ